MKLLGQEMEFFEFRTPVPNTAVEIFDFPTPVLNTGCILQSKSLKLDG